MGLFLPRNAPGVFLDAISDRGTLALLHECCKREQGLMSAAVANAFFMGALNHTGETRYEGRVNAGLSFAFNGLVLLRTLLFLS